MAPSCVGIGCGFAYALPIGPPRTLGLLLRLAIGLSLSGALYLLILRMLSPQLLNDLWTRVRQMRGGGQAETTV